MQALDRTCTPDHLLGHRRLAHFRTIWPRPFGSHHRDCDIHSTRQAATSLPRASRQYGKPCNRPDVRAQAGSSEALPPGASFGPRGVFLVGFTMKDSEAVAAWFQGVEPGFPVSHCSTPLLAASLGEALYSDYQAPQADLVKPRQAVGSGAAEATPSGGGGESPAGAASATVGPNGGGGSGRHGHSSAAPAGAAETVGSGTGRAGSHAAAGTSDQDGGAAAGPIGGGPLDGSSRSGGVGRAGGGMRPLGVQVSEPRRFAVHSYAGLLPMPRVAMLSGLTEMEWVGICELWDTTGLPQPIFASVTPCMLPIPLGNLLDRIGDEYARNDAVGTAGPPPSVIDVDQIRQKLHTVKARKAAAAAAGGSDGGSGSSDSGGTQPTPEGQAAAAQRLVQQSGRGAGPSGGRLQQVELIGGGGPSPAQKRQPGGQQEAEAEADEQRFAALRKKAGKLARQERRAAAEQGAAPPRRGFS